MIFEQLVKTYKLKEELWDFKLVLYLTEKA